MSAQPTTSKANNFRAFKVRNYRLYWLGQLVSLCGTWMQTTAQSWVVYSLTNSPLALGLVTTLQFLPILLFSLFGGVLADRVPKRKVVLVTQTLALLQAFVFGILVATGLIQIWHIYVLAACLGIINAIDNPVRQAFAAELVTREDRPSAIALNSMLFNTARVVGPALAGALIASVGSALALFLNAASFVAVIIAVLLMNPAQFISKPVRHEQTSPVQQLFEGLRYSRRTPIVFVAMLAVAFIGTFGYNFSVVIPLLGGFVLHTDAMGFGILSSAMGIGSLLGALFNTLSNSISLRRLLLASLGFSLFLGAVAFSTQMYLSELLLMCLGFCGVLFSTASQTLIQVAVPDELRGRVTSLYFLLFAGSTPIGALFIGTLSNALNVSDAIGLCAVLCLIGVALCALYTRRVRPTLQEVSA